MSRHAYHGRVAQSTDFNFEAFARDEAYIEANRALLVRVFSELPSPFFQVDIASGTGLVSQLVSILSRDSGKRGTVIGLDPDHYAVESARRNVPSTPLCRLEFMEGRAQDLARLLADRLPRAGADYVSIHDALHEVEEEDKSSVVGAMAGVLKPGGFFSYNSAFTSVALELSAMQVGRLKARAFAILGGRRDRKVKGLVTHTPEEYRNMITGAGLEVVYEARKRIEMSLAAMKDIARYPRFVYGVFADLEGEEMIPLARKSAAFIQALNESGLTELPRIWHEIIALKPVAATDPTRP